jgi:hypothetical protein
MVLICLVHLQSQPLLFLIFINDIVDDMLGLGRLFADDTSIGHTAHDETKLENMINIDLK